MNYGEDLRGSLADASSGSLAETFGRSYPATPASVPEARQALCEFAEAVGASNDLLDAIRLAASEALTNVVLHAYRGSPGRMHVTAALAGEELWLLVADDGSGLHAEFGSPGLGTGLAVIALQCDELAIVNRSSGGTELRMRFRLDGRSGANRGPNIEAGRAGPRAARREAPQSRGSVASAAAPASPRFSTIT